MNSNNVPSDSEPPQASAGPRSQQTLSLGDDRTSNTGGRDVTLGPPSQTVGQSSWWYGPDVFDYSDYFWWCLQLAAGINSSSRKRHRGNTAKTDEAPLDPKKEEEEWLKDTNVWVTEDALKRREHEARRAQAKKAKKKQKESTCTFYTVADSTSPHGSLEQRQGEHHQIKPDEVLTATGGARPKEKPIGEKAQVKKAKKKQKESAFYTFADSITPHGSREQRQEQRHQIKPDEVQTATGGARPKEKPIGEKVQVKKAVADSVSPHSSLQRQKQGSEIKPDEEQEIKYTGGARPKEKAIGRKEPVRPVRQSSPATRQPQRRRTQQEFGDPTNASGFLPEPHGNYEFTMACHECCDEYHDEMGQTQIRYMVKPHGIQCKKNILMVRRTYSLKKSWAKIRPRPLFHTYMGNYRLCHLQNQFTQSDRCAFPHSEEEIEFWEKDRDEKFVVKDFIQSKLPSGSRPGRGPPHSKAKHPSHYSFRYYCQSCGIPCDNERVWKKHCATESHRRFEEADKGHQWNHRPPPPKVTSGNFIMCKGFRRGYQCPYSSLADMHNICEYAHSQEELDEWTERYRWRKMKQEMLKEGCLPAFSKSLFKEYKEAKTKTAVITEELDDVQVHSDDQSTVYLDKKQDEFTWRFYITTERKKTLKKVVLLLDDDRHHFEFPSSLQIAAGDSIDWKTTKRRNRYCVQVNFQTKIFGSFHQCVIFDFGGRPVLLRHLSVEVGEKEIHDHIKSLRQKLDFHRWTAENREIVRFKEGESSDISSELVTLGASSVNQQMLTSKLNKFNYKEKMHHLLYLEERTRETILAGVDLTVEFEMIQQIQGDHGGMVWAPPGDLFARIQLNQDLNDETEWGKLMLSGVQSVFFATRKNGQPKRVYEALILKKERFGIDFEGKQRDYLFLHLSRHSCQELGLQAGEKIWMEVQFQIDRSAFAKMHKATDMLKDIDFLFPDSTQIPRGNQRKEREMNCEELDELNPKQREIVQHVMTDWTIAPIPMIVYGPFGTGKTKTIASATKILALKVTDARILICTLTNSAADLFITEYFDEFVEKNPGIGLLRVVYKDRWISSVPKKVHKYCRISSGGGQHFLSANVQDIQQQKIVITTLSQSVELAKLARSDQLFTHIFIDEAGQALECEATMPLSMKGPKTCIVIAGDHIQSSLTTIFSTEGRKQGLNKSLLERLFHHYKVLSKNKGHSALPLVLLTSNYRSHPDIMQFISSEFYGGPENILSAGNHQEATSVHKALEFFCTRGQEKQDPDSTSYYNMAEVSEVKVRVTELWDEWPSAWGSRCAGDIGIVAPYHDQVNKIRAALRAAPIPELGKVVVERVQNIQGKEFRVIFISTVRTCSDDACISNQTKDYGFLTSKKLLNTAMTRAKSLVAIVGDPTSMCTVGDCMEIWQHYLIQCDKMGTIYPEGMTYKKIEEEVMIRKRSVPDQETLHLRNPRLPPSGKVDGSRTPGITARQMSYSDMDDDQILKQLAMEAKRLKESTSNKHTDAHLARGTNQDAPLNMKRINIFEKQGQMYVDYSDDIPLYEREGRQPGDKLAGEGDSDYSKDDLLGLLKNSPESHKRCLLHIDYATKNMWAEVIDDHVGIKKIKFLDKVQCRGAFDHDVAVVEVFQCRSEECDVSKMMNGRVVGILQRAIEPRYHLLTCFVDPFNCGRMVPVNKGFPTIHNLHLKGKKIKKNHVAVYKFTENLKIKFDHFEPADDAASKDKLFLVRYLKWKEKYNSPLGIVVDILPPGKTFESGLQILDVEYCVPGEFDRSTLMEANQYLPITRHPGCDRWDYREKTVFSIDPEDSQDLDDALSFEVVNKEQCLVGVHIADVSHFIKKGSPLDKVARKRGTSFYPTKSAVVHMFPERLSTDAFSLREGTERPTLSVFLTVNNTGEVINVQPRRCKIRNEFQLTYKKAELILKKGRSTGIDDRLSESLTKLFEYSQLWRDKRLGVASQYQDLDEDDQDTPKAHQLVSELMIMANKQVAMYLSKKFPNQTLLRQQKPPDCEQLIKWKQNHSTEALNSIALRQPFLSAGAVCQCEDLCSEIRDSEFWDKNALDEQNIDVCIDIWQKLCQAIERGEADNAYNLVLSPKHHPQLLAAQTHLRRLQERGAYVRSQPNLEQSHYSLNLQVYTHFTSPIRRYVDIVVHRLLIAAMEDSPCPYSEEEMDEICYEMTAVSQRARRYHQAVQSLHLAMSLGATPLTTTAVVDEIQNAFMTVTLPDQTGISRNNIRFADLSVSKRPELREQILTLVWEKRIYDPNPGPIEVNEKPPKKCICLLNPDQYIIKIPVRSWQALLRAVRDYDLSKVKMLIQDIPTRPTMNISYSQEVTSEVKSGQVIHQHHCEFSLSLRSGQVMKIQWSAGLYGGLMTPTIQLVNLTPKLDLCIEHHAGAIECFSSLTQVVASKKKYDTVSEYQKCWLPAMEMEAAHTAIHGSDDGVVIHNIAIQWQSKNDTFTGNFLLDEKFCSDRNVFSPYINGGDYMCIRCQGVEGSTSEGETRTFCWVGHCLTLQPEDNEVKSEPDAKHIIDVNFILNQSCCDLPDSLLTEVSNRWTVEHIPKPTPNRRMERALSSLQFANQLAKDIALKKTPEGYTLEKHPDVKKVCNNKSLRGLNESQCNAVKVAFNQTFTLIQGPPGTGKTKTGAYLARIFSRENKLSSDKKRGKVLCCGPSNKSVDAIAVFLKRFKDLKLIRLYGNLIENQDFPVPNNPIPPRRRGADAEVTVPPEHQDIALHFAIRRKINPHASQIKEFDKIFQQRKDIDQGMIKKYKDLVKQAEDWEIESADIILSTCTASYHRGLLSNAHQVIIDECAMCQEPESMIPIIRGRPHQVVLIGDHKQLQPIITNRYAERLGLGVSLFERYSEQATMLTIQYRMHEAIAAFPSEQFYGGNLIAGQEIQSVASNLTFWPGPSGGEEPIVFGHIIGEEDALEVSTAEGNENSRSNRKEVEQVVRIANLLQVRYNVNPKDIIVMTQYRAQENEMKKGLNCSKNSEIRVCTVISSQGSEWDYVILSTVRSLPPNRILPNPPEGWRRECLGFITDYHQINVAITRAKKGLIIIGNKFLLKCDPMWRDLLQHYEDRGKVVEAEDLMKLPSRPWPRST